MSEVMNVGVMKVGQSKKTMRNDEKTVGNN